MHDISRNKNSTEQGTRNLVKVFVNKNNIGKEADLNE